jgi:hypothetical protein
MISFSNPGSVQLNGCEKRGPWTSLGHELVKQMPNPGGGLIKDDSREVGSVVLVSSPVLSGGRAGVLAAAIKRQRGSYQNLS